MTDATTSYRLFRSMTFLAQADRASLSFAAARSYRAFRSGLTRKWMRSVSPLSMWGLPLGRFG